MSDHEFEKQVQQKLGELKLRPSDAVWMEVEKNIRDKKRRRRFLWLWSAALLVSLTTSGIVLYHYTSRSANTLETTAKTTPAASASSSASSNSNSNSTTNTESPNSTNSTSTQASNGNRESAIGNETDNVTAPTEATASTNNSNQPGTIPPAAPAIAKASANKSTIGNESRNATMPNKVAILPNSPSIPTGRESRGEAALTAKNTSKKIIKNNNKKFVKETDRTEPAVLKENDAVVVSEPTELSDAFTAATLAAHTIDSITTSKAAIEPFSNMPLNALMPDSASSANAIAAMPIERKKASLWHWGVKADAGYSRISVSKLFQLKGLLGTQKSYAEDLAARSYDRMSSTPSNQFLNVSAGVTPVKVASPIQPDFSATFGVFIQRTLSPRLKVSVGLEYSYMSVNTNVGKAYDSSIAVNIGTNSLKVIDKFYESPGYIDNRGAYASIQGQVSGQAYYSQKKRYRFHYIEIPVLLNWQINKGRRLPPIVFEGGVSIGRLFSVDALHYEGVKGVYYEDNSLFNKTQFNFVTGLSVGLFQKSKHPIWIGPDLRYSLNGLVKKDVSKGQYIWSTGISFKMLLGRL